MIRRRITRLRAALDQATTHNAALRHQVQGPVTLWDAFHESSEQGVGLFRTEAQARAACETYVGTYDGYEDPTWQDGELSAHVTWLGHTVDTGFRVQKLTVPASPDPDPYFDLELAAPQSDTP
ncbi:MAG TPA: hypothetical protein VGX23_14160 [Actinocrinis sp.]|nr:hypothetical protein [Actinocrinis sp.]